MAKMALSVKGWRGYKKEQVPTTPSVNLKHPEAPSPPPRGEEGGNDMDGF
jgi:hypothetical protein